MRVIAGSARRLQLKTMEGMNTRPTTDRLKETLFNMINNQLYDCTFLDLFAGSGGIGIEALSRGARLAVFVDDNRNAIKCVNDNLVHTKLADKAKVLNVDYKTALKKLNKEDNFFDIIFLDPPYNHLFEKEVLIYLRESVLINQDSLIIIEASLETKFDYLQELGYEIVREKSYKTNKHLFVKLSGE